MLLIFHSEENTVDQLVENRRTAIRELHREFFNDVQDHILLVSS